MREIGLTRRHVALVDDADFEWLSQWKWHYATKGYAVRHDSSGTTRGCLLYMHRVIMDATQGMQVDHINHNGLDNRRENMRLCTNRQNCQNGHGRKTARAPYKGVFAHVDNWQATITVGGERLYLGTFSTPELAAVAYDEAAVKHFGEFACTNF